VVDCQHVFTADYTAAKGFEAMSADFRKRGQLVIFSNVGADVKATLLGPGGGEGIVVGHSQLELEQRLEGNCKPRLMLVILKKNYNSFKKHSSRPWRKEED
jgi:hypothetical protein